MQNLEHMQIGQKITFAEDMARQLGCPYTKQDLTYVDSFINQLYCIKRANELACQMGVGKIDFSVKRQSQTEYLQEQDLEENYDLLLKCLCWWQASIFELQKDKNRYRLF